MPCYMFKWSILFWHWPIQNKIIQQQHCLSTYQLELLEVSFLYGHQRQFLNEMKADAFHWLERTHAMINFVKTDLALLNLVWENDFMGFYGIAFGHPQLNLRKLSSAPLDLTIIWQLKILFHYTWVFLFTWLQ